MMEISLKELTPHERGVWYGFRKPEKVVFWRCLAHGLYWGNGCWHCGIVGVRVVIVK